MSGASSGWNYADVWEGVAHRFPDAPAVSFGTVTSTWRLFESRAEAFAGGLLAAGTPHRGRVAQLQRNAPEYLEVLFACFKASLAPVNTNYRYGVDELVYLWRDCDAAVVVFDAEFAATVDAARSRLPGVRRWVCTGPGDTCPPWATPYEAILAAGLPCTPPWKRSGDDLYILYTGGTTGRPKGVMWPQHELFQMLEESRGRPVAERADPDAFVRRLPRPGPAVIPVAPLMHGTASWFAFPVLNRGGEVVLLPGASFDAVRTLDAIVEHAVKAICIVGEAFARPILSALDTSPGRWNLDSLRVIQSSGAALPPASKRRLLQYARHAQIVDGLGSSESGVAASAVSADDASELSLFRPTSHTRVLDDNGEDVVPGSDTIGRLVVGGHLPMGYFGDPEKTAATFVELDGKRYAITGDQARVCHDGTIVLLGRGSSCINTGGEKVFPEEVEETLRALPGVADVAIVGVADDVLGESVAAVVLPEPGVRLSDNDIVAHAKSVLAHYKAPRLVVFVSSFPRGPHGKVDQQKVRELATAARRAIVSSPG
ncbi:AMP-binding protein [Mycolicibacterium sp.]|uniref:AMP-binding protein n=1 Tax=Mycolicibacterium sp. TaxID=2320850 RepID=UPI003D0A84C5